MTNNYKTARKYINVRYGFMKTKLLIALLMIVCCAIMALGIVDLGPMATQSDSLSSNERLLAFGICLLFIAANIYIVVSRILWMVKFHAVNEELETYILNDEKCRAYLKKVTDGSLYKRVTGGLYISETVALFLILYLLILIAAVLSSVKLFDRVTNDEFNPFFQHAEIKTGSEHK